MDSLMIYWLGVILLAVFVAGGLIYLAFWIPKKLGKKKLGAWLSAIITLIILSPFLSLAFEDYFFFKSDVIETLAEHQIKLHDDFNLESNKISGIGDYYHCYRLKITQSDKKRLIDSFLNSRNYRDNIAESFDLRADKPRYSDKDIKYSVTYQNKWSYVYEYYKPNKKGYAPTWDRISVPKNGTVLTYERIYD